MKLKAVAAGILAAVALTACGGAANPAGSQSPAGDAPKAIKVGIATIVSHPALDAAQAGFIEALKEAGYEEGKNVTFDKQNAQGDQSTLTNIANTFASSDYDAFFAIATPTAQALANVISDKPVVFAAVTDPVAAELVSSGEP